MGRLRSPTGGCTSGRIATGARPAPDARPAARRRPGAASRPAHPFDRRVGALTQRRPRARDVRQRGRPGRARSGAARCRQGRDPRPRARETGAARRGRVAADADATRSSASACSRRCLRSGRWRRSSARPTSAGTVSGTRTGSPARRSRSPPASSPRATPSTRCSPNVPTAPDCRSTMRVRELRANAGSQFDPAVVDVLVEVVTSSDAEVRRTPARSVPIEPRLSTIASLRGLLDVTRLVRRAGSLSSVLDAIARTVSDSLGLDTVVDQSPPARTDVFDVVTVHGSDEVRDALFATVNGWDEWAPLLDARFHRRGAYHIRAGEFDWTALEGHGWSSAQPRGTIRGCGTRRTSCSCRSTGRTAPCSGSSRSASRAAAAVRRTRSSTCSSRWRSMPRLRSRASKSKTRPYAS